MQASMGRWLVLASCVLAAASAAEDNVLRFLSHKQVVQMAQQLSVQSTVCPNGITQCPDTSTCCPLTNGQYGCCKGVNAVCCKDGEHCCPDGYECDEQKGQCTPTSQGLSPQWADKAMQRARPAMRVAAPNITCNDNRTKCQPNDTCCLALSGYGCCPFSKGVCCMDRVHCCPMGTKCDITLKRCYRQEGNWEAPWVERRSEKSEPSSEVRKKPSEAVAKKWAVVCKDGLMCPDGNTCCQLRNGSYGCCPFSDAVCCSDHVHCCPHGCVCDYVKQGCTSRGHLHKWLHIVRPPHMAVKKEQTPVSNSNVQSVICPGGTSQCPDGSTCCIMTSGQYGCCPIPDAVCCSDHIHCCPRGYTCDVTHGKCDQGQVSVPWLQKEPSVKRVESVVCPGGQSECPDGSTCCKLSSGQYGCCPIPNAVCCSDGSHCCPQGYTCDTAQGTCQKGEESVPWLQKVSSVKRVESVICPDGQSECPDGSTCCKLSSGQYGCCPIPNAVCCSDGSHCCPQGYTCDTAQGTCLKGEESVPWLQKVPSVKRVGSVVCPGGQVECPDGSTCCKLSTGQFGCCPIPQAVCCSDGIHCCPHGYSCIVSQGRCQKGEESVQWLRKVPAVTRVESVKCPDGKSECPDGNTCCKLNSEEYGCCPFPYAVCCKDKKHCCPEAHKCDLAKKTCDIGIFSVPWEKKQPARRSVP